MSRYDGEASNGTWVEMFWTFANKTVNLTTEAAKATAT